MRAAPRDGDRAGALRLALVLAAFVGGGCGRVALEPRPSTTVDGTSHAPEPAHADTAPAMDTAPDGDAPFGGARDGDARDGDTRDGGPPDGDVASNRSSGDAMAPPWPLILRIENVGARPVFFPEVLVALCGFELSVRAAGEPSSSSSSITEFDTWCPCNACQHGRLVCESTDFLCDGPERRLEAGEHFDLAWDGQRDVKRPLPPDAGCVGTCDALEMVAPGRYVFTVSPNGGRVSETEVWLPSATGVVELPVSTD